MTDLVIIGAGPGGFDTALFAAERGLDVVLIEKEQVGGTCLNWGCIPTKALYHNAKHLLDLAELDTFGVDLKNYSIDYDKIRVRKEQIVADQIDNIETSLERSGVRLIRGTATIDDATHVRVGDETIETSRIIIATGSSVRPLDFPGNDLDIVVDSRRILELTTFPKRLVVIGGGVIGCEMASIFRAFECEVTLVEFQSDLLPPFDADLRKRARNLYKRAGIDIHTNSELTEVKATGDSHVAVVKTKKGDVEIPTDMVLVATGRVPNYGGLDLTGLAIAHTKHGISVDANKMTSVDGIYAIGDVNGELMLAHKATYDGYKAVSHILGDDLSIRFDLVPSVVFSFPEIAAVGKTEDELKGNAVSYRKNKYLYKTNGKAQCMNETDGFVKMLVDDNGVLLGCHIIGADASTLIHEVTAMMNRNITIDDYKSVIHAHPTLSEIIGECIKGFD